MRIPLNRLCIAALAFGYVASANAMETEVEEPTALAYFGDPSNDLVYIVDVDNFSLHRVYQLPTGSKPYPIDHTSDEHTYISTRGVSSVSVINNFDLDAFPETLALTHTPRSTTYNATKGRAAVSGGNVSRTTVIKSSNSAIKSVSGAGLAWNPAVNTDFGGTLATGHPFWHKGKKFFQLDRVQRQIELYNKHGDLLDSLATPSTAHHLLRAPEPVYGRKSKRTYFAAIEGNPFTGVRPGILKFRVKANQLEHLDFREVDCGACSASVMGGHHADLSPDGLHIYMGSREGNTYVLDSLTLDTVASIPTGTGAGHTRFIGARNLAVVTNHNDSFMTFIDTQTLNVVANVTVSGTCTDPAKKWQGHTTGVSPDNKYLYMLASCDGVMQRIDLDTLLVDSLDLTAAATALGAPPATGIAYPIQGAKFIWE